MMHAAATGRSLCVPAEYRATTVQVCGPWAVGSGTPMIGTPVGHHLHTGATVR